MIEQFFECEDNGKAFKDYASRQEWAEYQLAGCKFVWALEKGVSVSQIFTYIFSLFLSTSKLV